jgi:hypothetical protein
LFFLLILLLLLFSDSNMFVQQADRPLIVPEGDMLGEMKRELANRRITEYAAGGPKNYAELHEDRLTGGDQQAEVECRGFTLNYRASQILNYQRLKAMVFSHFNLGPMWANNIL